VDLERDPESTRRTIYAVVDRSDLLDAFVNFDFANPDMPSGKRYETSVPQQALFLMNSPVVIEQAKKLVSLKTFEACTDDTSRIQFLYERIYQRPARPPEIQLGLDFLAQAPLVDQAAPLLAKRETTDPQRGPMARKEMRQQMMEERKAERTGGKRLAPKSKNRSPLTGWQEYAHALLQANEASFVN